MKLEITVNDIKDICFSKFNDIDELATLQNMIADKIHEIEQQRENYKVERYILHKYDYDEYNKFMDICMGLSMSWASSEEWKNVFIPAFEEFILDALGLAIHGDEMTGDDFTRIFKIMNIPFKCREVGNKWILDYKN
jgi:hypothetical protein